MIAAPSPALSAGSSLGFWARTLAAALLILAAASASAGTVAAQGLAPTGTGQVRALLIGINAYDRQPVLKGAVADAEDLERTLRKLGVRDLRILRDREASRAAILAEMDRLIAATGRGDLVVLTYAGHGTRLPEHFAGSNPTDDPYDEVFVLSGFGEEGAGTQQRILDKEINAWLRRLEDKGATVLFVADSCHAGGAARSIDARAEPPSYRQTNTVKLKDDQFKPVTTARDARLSNDDFKTVTFLAAVDAYTKAPEIRVPGEPSLRGAVSFAVARALEGGADRNGDGVTTRRELIGYTRQQTMQLSDGLQTPTSAPQRPDALDTPLFRKIEVVAAAPAARPSSAPDAPKPTLSAGMQAPSPPVTAPQAGILQLAVLNGSTAALAGVQPLETRFVVVDRGAGPDLIWDAAKNEVLSSAGDVVARGIKAADLPDVVDRTAAIAALQRASEQRAQAIAVLPDSRLHRSGERVSFEVGEIAGRHLTLFNIAGDGTVQYLFPRDRDSRVLTDAMSLPLTVTPPFGADQTVAVVSFRPLPAFEAALARLNNRRAAGRIPALIVEHLADPGIRIGHAGLFSGP